MLVNTAATAVAILRWHEQDNPTRIRVFWMTIPQVTSVEKSVANDRSLPSNRLVEQTGYIFLSITVNCTQHHDALLFTYNVTRTYFKNLILIIYKPLSLSQCILTLIESAYMWFNMTWFGSGSSDGSHCTQNVTRVNIYINSHQSVPNQIKLTVEKSKTHVLCHLLVEHDRQQMSGQYWGCLAEKRPLRRVHLSVVTHGRRSTYYDTQLLTATSEHTFVWIKTLWKSRFYFRLTSRVRFKISGIYIKGFKYFEVCSFDTNLVVLCAKSVVYHWLYILNVQWEKYKKYSM